MQMPRLLLHLPWRRLLLSTALLLLTIQFTHAEKSLSRNELSDPEHDLSPSSLPSSIDLDDVSLDDDSTASFLEFDSAMLASSTEGAALDAEAAERDFAILEAHAHADTAAEADADSSSVTERGWGGWGGWGWWHRPRHQHHQQQHQPQQHHWQHGQHRRRHRGGRHRKHRRGGRRKKSSEHTDSHTDTPLSSHHSSGKLSIPHSSSHSDQPSECNLNKALTDLGYQHDRQCIDLRESGQRRDFGRWIGVGKNIYYSVALFDCPNQYSDKGEYLLVDGHVTPGPNYRGKGVCTPVEECKSNPYLTDQGYAWNRICTDLRGTGLKRDFGRWVGVGENVYYSVALWQCENQYTAKGEYLFVDGKITRGPNWSTSECQTHKDVKRKSERKNMEAQQQHEVTPQPSTPWSATPLEQVNYPDLHVSRASYNTSAKITCPNKGEHILIKDATFGVGFSIYQQSGNIVKGTCHAHSALEATVKKCNNEHECEMRADMATFTDPCPTISSDKKSLLVVYSCVRTEVPKTVVIPVASQVEYPGIKSLTTQHGSSAIMSCTEKDVIVVLDASYGVFEGNATVGLYAENGYITRGHCRSKKSSAVVGAECHGKQACTVHVDTESFPLSGDEECQHQPKEKRVLKVTYRCAANAPTFKKPEPPKPDAPKPAPTHEQTPALTAASSSQQPTPPGVPLANPMQPGAPQPPPSTPGVPPPSSPVAPVVPPSPQDLHVYMSEPVHSRSSKKGLAATNTLRGIENKFLDSHARVMSHLEQILKEVEGNVDLTEKEPR